MVEAERSVSHYWVDPRGNAGGSTASEALAYAQVYARLLNAEAVVAYAYAPEGRTIIFDWSAPYWEGRERIVQANVQ